MDEDGRPHFTINDYAKVDKLVRQKLCALCGTRLEFDTWLIGGPGAAFHTHGAFLDPPAHHACATYALQTCPFLAAPSYSHRIDDRTLDMAKLQGAVLVKEEAMQPEQPPFFVHARTARIERYRPSDQPGVVYFIPHRPWRNVEFWKDGKQIDSEEAKRLYLASEQQSGPLEDLVWWSDE